MDMSILRPPHVPVQSGVGAYIMLTRAEVHGNSIVIKPFDPRLGGPGVTIPNTTGAQGFTEWSLNFHKYWVPTTAPPELNSAEGLDALGRALVDNATPGVDRPATRQGTRNDVGSIWFGDSGHNFVNSFVAPSPNPGVFTPLVINYTIHGEHTVDEGFVIRYARRLSDGVILISYGEGRNWKQNMMLEDFWLPQVYAVWTKNQREIILTAKQMVSSPSTDQTRTPKRT